MSKDYMVTTTDNPFNYYTEFDQWFAFDTSRGYHTLSYLARITRTSPELPPQLEEQAIQDAVDEILAENIGGLYKKVEAPDEIPTTSDT